MPIAAKLSRGLTTQRSLLVERTLTPAEAAPVVLIRSPYCLITIGGRLVRICIDAARLVGRFRAEILSSRDKCIRRAVVERRRRAHSYQSILPARPALCELGRGLS